MRPSLPTTIRPTTRPAARRRPGRDKKDDDDDPDEEALLRDAVPNAEEAVIGEEEADPPPPPKPGVKKVAPAPAPAPAAASRRPPPPKTAASDKPAPAPAKVETAVLHITSAPKGAIVRTKCARSRPHADQPALQDRQHLRAEAGQARLQARDPQGGRQQHQGSQDRREPGEEEARPEEAIVLPPAPMTPAAILVATLAWGVPPRHRCAARGARHRPSRRAAPGASRADAASPRAAAVAAFERARARAASASAVVRDITLPSIERLIQDADIRARQRHRPRTRSGVRAREPGDRARPTRTGSRRATIPIARRPG